MRFILGLIVGIVVAVAAPVVLLWTGRINLAATSKPSNLEERLGEMAQVRWMKRAAPNTKNPYSASDAPVLQSGFSHYKENCVICHGAPGVEGAELSKGLNPSAPLLDTDFVKNMSDGELFLTVRDGIRLTGMPGFGPTHSDEELWQIVAFVRHLPDLTQEETSELKETTEQEDHHHDGEEPEQTDKPEEKGHQHAPETPPHED